MAFKFTLETVPSTESVDTLLDDVTQFTEIKGEIESLIGQLPELESVMDNLSNSLELLQTAKNPDQILEVLNGDKSIECLLGIAEDQISVKLATEGLGDALKNAWEKVKAFFKKIWEWIKSFFSGTSKKVEDDTSKSKALKDSIKDAEPEELKKILEEPMPGLLSKKCVLDMYKNAGYLGGTKGPIASYIRNMTNTVTAAEKYIKELEQGTGKDSFDAMFNDIWGSVAASTGADLLKSFGMTYTFSFDDGLRLSKVDEGFLEKCDTLKAGGWTSAIEYTDQCAVVCNTTYNLYKDWLRNQSTIQSDLDKCAKLSDKLKELTAKKINFRASSLRDQLTTLAKGLGIIAVRLKQINGACYCAALDARVQKILNRNVQPQHKLED